MGHAKVSRFVSQTPGQDDTAKFVFNWCFHTECFVNEGQIIFLKWLY